MRFSYDDSYHTGLSMMPCKVLYDDHVDCLSIRQVQTSMSFWIFGHKDMTKGSVLFVKS